jgi:hypothetical protein
VSVWNTTWSTWSIFRKSFSKDLIIPWFLKQESAKHLAQNNESARRKSSLSLVHARGTKRKQTEHTHAKKRDTVRGHREIVFARFPRVAVRTELQSSLRALLVGLNLCLIKGFHVA